MIVISYVIELDAMGQHVSIGCAGHADVPSVTGRVIGSVAKVHGSACRYAFVEEDVHAELRSGFPWATCYHRTPSLRMSARINVDRDECLARDLRMVLQKIIDRVGVCQPPVDRIDRDSGAISLWRMTIFPAT